MLHESSIVCVCLAMVGGRLLCLGLNLLSPFTDSHGFLHSPLIDIVDGDDKLAVPDLAVNHGWVMPFVLAGHVRSAAHNLHPFMLFIRLVEPIDVLVSSKQKLTFSLLEQRSPELGTGALPLREVALMLVIHISRIEVAGIHVGSWVIERDVAEGNQIGSTLYLRLLQRIAKPSLLRHTVRLADKEVAEPRVGVQFILACVKTNESDVAHWQCANAQPTQ